MVALLEEKKEEKENAFSICHVFPPDPPAGPGFQPLVEVPVSECPSYGELIVSVVVLEKPPFAPNPIAAPTKSTNESELEMCITFEEDNEPTKALFDTFDIYHDSFDVDNFGLEDMVALH